MKTDIFYFTGTGNSLACARSLSKKIGKTRLISIKDIIKNKKITSAADRVIFVFPVYSFGYPVIVGRLIEKIVLGKKAKAYAFVTYGGMLARALPLFRKKCEKNGITLSGGFSAKMPGNYQIMSKVSPVQKQKALIQAAKDPIDKASKIIINGDVFGFDTNLGLLGALFSKMHHQFESHIHDQDSKFWTTDSCNNCGICAKICPVENIALKNKKPVWKHKCEQCLACMHWCPAQAVQYGKRTLKNGRYQHPEIKLKDMI